MSHEPGLPLGIGLIGVGHHGSRYAKHLLQDLPEARLAAVSRRRTAGGNGMATDADVIADAEAAGDIGNGRPCHCAGRAEKRADHDDCTHVTV